MEKNNNLILLPTQKTSISHSLQYSLRILEMNNLQLREYIQTALVENPFLEEDEIEDHEYENSPPYSRGLEFLENLASKKSFKDELIDQMSFLRFNSNQKEVAELLIENIIDGKYLSGDIMQGISQEKNISCFDILKIIKQLQAISPCGLFSFNIKDKIKSSLESSGKYNGNCKIFVQNLDLVLTSGLQELKKKCRFDNEEITKIKSDIQNLKLDFPSVLEDPSYVIPDVMVESKTKDEYEASVNSILLPQLSMDRRLYESTIKHSRSENDIKYAKEKIESAKLLIKSINYRNSTLLKVVKEIVYRQYDFFAGYSTDIIPISVKAIANVLMLHEGTIHRAIANKSISTPRGIFDVKTLMPKKIKSTDKPVSNHSVKEQIKYLINQESKNAPYSDSDIMHFLHSKGIVISRRTIAKYRNVLNIPKVTQRMKFYKVTNALAF